MAQQLSMINVALISPNKNAYSETFIQFHRTRLNANVFYLYNEPLPRNSEDNKLSINYNLFNRLRRKIYKLFFNSHLSFHEKAIGNYFVRHDIKVVLAEYGMTGVAMLKICSKLNIPLIVHFHGLDAYMKTILKENEASYKKLFKQAAYIVAVSNDMVQQLKRLGCTADKIILNPCGPSENFFCIKPGYNSKKILAVGRFVEKKAPQKTIVAFSKVLKKHPGAFLQMVGEGPLLNECKQLIEDLQITNKVKFSGVLSPEKIIELYKLSAAFVQHSVTALNGDSEGTPVAVLEASAGALPVIATAHAGIKDVVLHEETGLLCKENDMDAMAENMDKILSDPALAAKLGTNGRKRIQQHFTLEKHIAVLNGLIYKVV